MPTGAPGAERSLTADVRRALLRLSKPRGERVIVFTRYPEPGRTKTRLIPVLGREGAAELQRRMTEHTMRAVGALMGRRPLRLEVRYDDGAGDATGEPMRRWLGGGLSYRAQGAGDLGERMRRAFADAFDACAERAVILGCDCPGITPDLLERALIGLRRHDLVLGPASDGGYYLIGLRRSLGLRRSQGRLFEGMPWGTGGVFARTLAAAREIGLSVSPLDTLDDVDRPDDLPVWQRAAEPGARAASLASVSVIIPALNESTNVSAAVMSAARALGAEVIVVDGGSEDGTPEVARSCGATVLTARRGRGRQMNVGAAAASGEALVFLHADTQLPWGYEACVQRALAEPGVVGGAFRFAIAGSGAGLRAIERLTDYRARRLQMPYGDQAIFLRRDTFCAMGGFAETPIMEDYEFVARLRRRGRIAILAAPALTSARRWDRLGVFRTTLINQVMILGHKAGVSPERLARWYRASRRM